jgi:hypothetical protein
MSCLDMVQFIYVCGLCLAAFYAIAYVIAILGTLFGFGGDALERQRQERIRLYANKDL